MGEAGTSYGHANAQLQGQLKAFWETQLEEVKEVPPDPAEFKNHQLPLARIKKIMKSDEDVRMISAEAPVLFAKACEMFILELTLRSWNHAEENKRRTLQRNDVAAAILRTDIFDFLVDIVPREDLKQEDGQQLATGTSPPAQGPAPAAVIAPPGVGAPPMGMQPIPQMPPGVQPQSMGMFYPGMYPGMDPSGVMRPPMPMDPNLLYQQQAFFAQQGAAWPMPVPMQPGAGMGQPGGAGDANSQQ